MTRREKGQHSWRTQRGRQRAGSQIETRLPGVSEGGAQSPIEKPPGGGFHQRDGGASARPGSTADDPLLTAAQVAAILGIRTKAVYELDIPRVELSPRRYRWRLSDLNAWIDARRKT